MFLVAGAPEHPEDETVLDMEGADALYSAVNSVMQATQTENRDVQQDAGHRVIQIANLSMLRRWCKDMYAGVRPRKGLDNI